VLSQTSAPPPSRGTRSQNSVVGVPARSRRSIHASPMRWCSISSDVSPRGVGASAIASCAAAAAAAAASSPSPPSTCDAPASD